VCVRVHTGWSLVTTRKLLDVELNGVVRVLCACTCMFVCIYVCVRLYVKSEPHTGHIHTHSLSLIYIQQKKTRIPTHIRMQNIYTLSETCFWLRPTPAVVSICVCMCVFVCMYVCVCVYMSIRSFVQMDTCSPGFGFGDSFSVSVTLSPSAVCVSFPPLSLSLSLSLSVCVSPSLSPFLSVCVCVCVSLSLSLLVVTSKTWAKK